MFTEAEVRASVVFQLSGLLSTLLKAARQAADCVEWDALVAGVLWKNYFSCAARRNYQQCPQKSKAMIELRTFPFTR